ncbi:hypothetical protein C8034_v006284 [Colletotrichum sidae]|uniref:Uncharacterized protein n=1 Tax=Colletotrichum sidae TaxID=1347389 RepID=A0A4R8TSI3_9PEZI|nr:hypothetical protein C8034_v006284 [Colletotrichum sidae]
MNFLSTNFRRPPRATPIKLEVIDDDEDRSEAALEDDHPLHPKVESISLSDIIEKKPSIFFLILIPLIAVYMNLNHINTYLTSLSWETYFYGVFYLRYSRLVLNLVGTYLYEHVPVPQNPRWDSGDVTVVVPTIDPGNPKFTECLQSILENRPRGIRIVTVGDPLLVQCERVAARLRNHYPWSYIHVSSRDHPSKREQVAEAVRHVATELTVLADDHVFWPSRRFLASAIAPFESDRVGVVAPFKRVRRSTPAGEWSVASVLNLVGCCYLQRHNWELRASNALDGGVFVVSGRTAVYRTRFLRSGGLMDRYTREMFFFGMLGGRCLLPDDDNFLTRAAYRLGWDVRWQETDDAAVETTLGDEGVEKFRGQLIRWARTTFRSNPCNLWGGGGLAWQTATRMPFSYVGVYFAALCNFALLWDAAIVVTFCRSGLYNGVFGGAIWKLLGWIVFSKTVKIWPHFKRYPQDLPLIVFQVLFGYVHSFIKFWALITFWDCTWLGRNLEAVDAMANAGH